MRIAPLNVPFSLLGTFCREPLSSYEREFPPALLRATMLYLGAQVVR